MSRQKRPRDTMLDEVYVMLRLLRAMDKAHFDETINKVYGKKGGDGRGERINCAPMAGNTRIQGN